MSFGWCISPVNFNGITHGLKGVERQADGKDNIQQGNLGMLIETAENSIYVTRQKIIVLKND